jgi:hypothetical protein
MKCYDECKALVNGWSDPVSTAQLYTCEWNVHTGTYHEVCSCVGACFGNSVGKILHIQALYKR